MLMKPEALIFLDPLQWKACIGYIHLYLNTLIDQSVGAMVQNNSHTIGRKQPSYRHIVILFTNQIQGQVLEIQVLSLPLYPP
jgi:hypothetical protein